MQKVSVPIKPMLYPLPAAMVTCGSNEEEYNIITISWTGTVCSEPPMCYVSVRPSRHSYKLIKENGEFVINLTSKDLVHEMDWCGMRSGKNYNKFEHTGLTPVKADLINAPLIKEAPVNIECKVKDIISLGTHDMFLAEMVAVHVNAEFVKDGKPDLRKANLVCYADKFYYDITNITGEFGFSMKK